MFPARLTLSAAVALRRVPAAQHRTLSASQSRPRLSAAVTVTLNDDGRFADVILSRPEKHNCLSPETMDALVAELACLGSKDEVRAVFLKAEGESFCAGGDLKHMRATGDFSFEENEADAMRLSGVFDALYSFPRPVVAIVAGNTFGGGLGLISACDMAFGLTGLKFSFTETKLGIIPATIAPYVVDRIGVPAANRLFLTAEVFDSEMAEKIDLLSGVVGSSEELDAIEAKLKKNFLAVSPDAAKESKVLIAEVAKRPVDLATRQWTAAKLAEVRASKDGREGMSSFIERRKPAWAV